LIMGKRLILIVIITK